MDRFQQILRQYWGYDDFRGIQRDIIESIAAGRDTLGLMPTGGGKSITFQVPALSMEGLCLVITPLISLMDDQVQHLRRQNIVADCIHTGMTRQQVVQTLDNCVMGQTKFLYISPERLASDLFQTKIQRANVSFICVDEAHCISQWGYDFRPSYLQIAAIRRLKPGCPVLALTATATPRVVADIQIQLQFRKENVFKMSFSRPNLSYVVRHNEDKSRHLVHIIQATKGSAIVYTRSRQRTGEIAKLLTDLGVSATCYHAGLEPVTKQLRQEMWLNDEVRVMVATNAFGMGIDKPDVRLVVHYDVPNSIEAYFQEAGRAGRDGKRAYAVLLFNSADPRKLRKQIAAEFPPKDYIQRVYNEIAYFLEIGEGYANGCTYNFNIQRFCHDFHHMPKTFEGAMKILARAGYASLDLEPNLSSRLRFTLGRDDLYRLQRLTQGEDTVVNALLRHYSGLFVDFVNINEAFIASQCEMTADSVYLNLESLVTQGIIDYIPARDIPRLTFLRERTAEPIVLSPEVYDFRKADYTERIEAMITYAAYDDTCRSQLLLAYFGETDAKPCGHCDVCLR